MPSSAILAMRYEPRRRELLIIFRGGRGAYRYFDVPIEEWQAFRSAESKGTYLNRIFKGRCYRYERIASAATQESPPTTCTENAWGGV